MEMFRNMEVALMLCFGLICAAALLARPQADDTRLRADNAVASRMPVVVITGKRLSAAGKARLQNGQEAG
jgi:hypothetical protein